ncbi:hypothetical protein [Nonomuraea rosea]|uniref:hypothetical protein n=1 Tax=Nonomuraea rosea TaxID=638574 RepID=UPI0031E4FF43
MADSSPYLSATADAYDAVADLYADLARDSLDRLPLDRAILAEFRRVLAPGGYLLLGFFESRAARCWSSSTRSRRRPDATSTARHEEQHGWPR